MLIIFLTSFSHHQKAPRFQVEAVDIVFVLKATEREFPFLPRLIDAIQERLP